jgi:hypothetical protein
MKVVDYLQKIDEICKREFISGRALVRELGICFLTLKRIKRDPACCSFQTAKKLKRFVEEWQTKNEI